MILAADCAASPFDGALRGLEVHLRRAGEAAAALAECHRQEVSGKQSFHRTTAHGGMGATSDSYAIPAEPVELPVLREPSGASVLDVKDLQEVVASARMSSAMMVYGGGRGSLVKPLPMCLGDGPLATPRLSMDSATAPLSDCASQKSGRKTNVIFFETRKVWNELSDEQLSAFVPQYVPTVNLHSMVSAGRNMHFLLGAVRKTQPLLVVNRVVKTRVMNPNGRFRLAWNFPSILLVAYDAFFVPLQAFHVEDDPVFSPTFRAMEWLGTIFWTFDLCLSMRTGYYEGTYLEMRPEKIVEHYVKTWFAFDLALVFMDWLSRFAALLQSTTVVRVTRGFRIVRCVRLLRLAKLQAFWRTIEDQINSSIVLLCFGVAKMLLAFIVFVHALACGWFAIGESRHNGWTSYEPVMSDSIAFWYFASCRWTLAQINGRTDMNERRNMIERLFTCVVAVVFAVLFMAVFLSCVTAAMLELSTLSEEQTNSKRSVNEYLEHHEVSVGLVASIKRHLAAKATLQSLVNEEVRERTVLSQIPEHLQYDLLYQIRSPVLRRHSFFRDVEKESMRVMRHVCFAAIRPMLAHRCEEIFNQGDVCSRMLWLEKGKCVYEQFEDVDPADVSCDVAQMRGSKSNDTPHSGKAPTTGHESYEWEPICKVRPGMWLSEPALWMEWENQGQLAAEVDSSLYTVDALDLARALLNYKDGYSMAVLYARKFVGELKSQHQHSDLMRVVLSRESRTSTRSIATLFRRD